MTTKDLLPILDREMSWAFSKYGPYHNAHEQYAVMLEECDEWWQAVKGNLADSAHYELIQIAAAALRYVLENGDVESIARVQGGRHRMGH